MAEFDGQPVRVRDPRITYPFGGVPDWQAVTEVSPGVFWLRVPVTFDLGWINVWLLADGDGWVLIDTGLGDEASIEYWRMAASGVLAGRPIKRIICTHLHPDHIGCAGALSREYKVSLHMTQIEYITARMLVADTGRAAPPEGINFYHAAGWNDDAIEVYRSRFGMFGKAVTPLPESYVRLTEGQVLKIGDGEWQVVLTNGHSPQHACLWNERAKLFISGDQILPRISSNVSVHATEPDANPLKDWLNSCAKLRALLPEDTLVLPAHNEPFFGVHARLDGLITNHGRTLERVWQRLTEPKRVIDLYGAMFARDLGSNLDALATGETLAHLQHLIGDKRAVRSTDSDGVWRYVQA